MKCRDCFHRDACETLIRAAFPSISEDQIEKTLDEGGYCGRFLSTDDVTKVEHAEWGRPVYIDGLWSIPCSHCLYSTSVRVKEFRPLFCSNCGAKMYEERSEDV